MGKKKDKKEKKAGKHMTKKQLAKALLDFFHQKEGETLTLKYIFNQLHLATHPQKMLCVDILAELKEDDYILEPEKQTYRLNTHGVEMTGTFQRKNNGKNAFIPDEGGDPVFIAERNCAHAMSGDRVRIAFYARRRGRQPEGEVIEIDPDWEGYRRSGANRSLAEQAQPFRYRKTDGRKVIRSYRPTVPSPPLRFLLPIPQPSRPAKSA